MPNLDQTGPTGLGPRTGRGLGHCGGGPWSRGGYRGGCGFGFRRFFSPKNEQTALENEKRMLEEELAAIEEELAALKAQ